jgi:hypothetical protein
MSAHWSYSTFARATVPERFAVGTGVLVAGAISILIWAVLLTLVFAF